MVKALVGPSVVVQPDRSNMVWRVAMYLLPFVFYGPVAVMPLLLLDLPPKHFAYFVAYAIGVIASLAWVHWGTKKILNGCYFALSEETLELGQEPKTVIRVSDIAKAVPVAYRYRPFRRPIAEAVTSERFNVLLLRLNDGSRLPLAPVSNVRGFDRFFAKLVDVVRPVLQERGELSDEDINAMLPSRLNTLQNAGA
jgi:hypothetical protein